MKSQNLKIAMLIFALSGMLAVNAFSQTTTPANAKASAQKPEAQSKTGSTKELKKEEFTKRLNEIQPKVQELTAKAATEKNESFTKETGALNSMVNDFKAKLDRYDNVPEAQRQQYHDNLQKNWEAIEAQHKKVNEMMRNMHGDKAAPKIPKEAANPK